MIDYSSLISDKARTIKPSGIRKFFDIVHTMSDAISLGVGEPDFQTPWPEKRRMKTRLERELNRLHAPYRVSYDQDGRSSADVMSRDALATNLKPVKAYRTVSDENKLADLNEPAKDGSAKPQKVPGKDRKG